MIIRHCDYLIIGAGLYGAVLAREAKAAGKSVLVVDKRPHIAGNVYTEDIEGTSTALISFTPSISGPISCSPATISVELLSSSIPLGRR